MTKKITSIDDDTELWAVNQKKEEAEPLKGFFVYHADRLKLKNKDFFFMFQTEHLTNLALNPQLQGNDYRLLLLLFGYLDFDNYISITQKQLSAATKIGQSHISESLKRLEEQGIITKTKKGNRNVYKLNSSYGWKGKISEFQKEEKERKQKSNVIKLPIKQKSDDAKTSI